VEHETFVEERFISEDGIAGLLNGVDEPSAFVMPFSNVGKSLGSRHVYILEVFQPFRYPDFHLFDNLVE
jgi:hypothetical protein